MLTVFVIKSEIYAFSFVWVKLWAIFVCLETSRSGQLRTTSLTQTSLKQFMRQVGMPLTKARYDFMTNKLVKMCAQDCRPISIGEGRGFKDFIMP